MVGSIVSHVTRFGAHVYISSAVVAAVPTYASERWQAGHCPGSLNCRAI